MTSAARKATVLAMVSSGVMTPGEAAKYAKLSRQLVYRWVKAAGIDHKKARRIHVLDLWRSFAPYRG